MTTKGTPDSRLESSVGALTSRRIAVVAATLVCASILGAMLWQSAGAERRAVRSLPVAERSALYERTLKTLESCERTGRPSGLTSFCSDQATFVLEFPECSAECRALADRVRAWPSR